ncbi:thioesterase [Labrenzia sp. C1B10]|uniref:acyl-CoA thioesterase n=1 Tax=unclassified Labrenzia TaxID=2648686 RepID=UPI0003B81286|nr:MULTISPECIES: thioesterase family protein [unclassified Labrenzia]ERP98686.1 thioesterase [Labrenzia sp. C1B10]ERS01044.1 thioesterase [Labrenzia sp. C1B70]
MFRFEQPILFKHCDPAGIVFYPRYFEMMNDCVEAFFDKVVEWPFKDIHKVGAVPTAEIRTRFMAPSKLGDLLVLGLNVTKVGRTSCGIAISAQCDGEVRFQTELTIVNVDNSGKPEPWPEQVKQRFLDQSALA